jgi:hypothetical protein
VLHSLYRLFIPIALIMYLYLAPLLSLCISTWLCGVVYLYIHILIPIAMYLYRAPLL